MQVESGVAENKENINSLQLLTSTRHPIYCGTRIMETAIEVTKRKENRRAAYPLRFKTKGQKERLERAARKSGKSLRDFILHSAESAADSVLATAKAS